MIMLNDVLEHLHDSPRELLNDAIECIRPGGFLFVTVPSVVNLRKRVSVFLGQTNLPDYDTYFWYPDPWRGPVREYTKRDLKKMVHYLGLEIKELKGCHHMLERVPKNLRLIYKFITWILPNTKDTWMLIAKKPDNWMPQRSLSKEKFDEIMANTKMENRRKSILIN